MLGQRLRRGVLSPAEQLAQAARVLAAGLGPTLQNVDMIYLDYFIVQKKSFRVVRSDVSGQDGSYGVSVECCDYRSI